jgi:hypothetical protein
MAEGRIIVRYERAAGGDAGEGVARETTLAGTFIETATPLEAGALLALELVCGDTKVTIDARVTSSRKLAEGPDAPAGMAIRFLELPDDVQGELRRILAASLPREKTVLGVGGAAPVPPPAEKTILGVGGPPAESTQLGLGAPTPAQIAEERAKAAGGATTAAGPPEKEPSWGPEISGTPIESEPPPLVPPPGSEAATRAAAPVEPAPPPPPPAEPAFAPEPAPLPSLAEPPPPYDGGPSPPPSYGGRGEVSVAAGVPKKSGVFRWLVVLSILAGGGAAAYMYHTPISRKLAPYVGRGLVPAETAAAPSVAPSAPDAEALATSDGAAGASTAAATDAASEDAASAADAAAAGAKDAGAKDAGAKDAGKDGGRDGGKHDAGHPKPHKPKPPPPPPTATSTE